MSVLFIKINNFMCNNSFFSFMNEQKELLLQNGQFKTAVSYSCTLNSFFNFRRGKDLGIEEVTSELIQSYQSWLKQRGVVANTSSFYMRVLRAVYNKAVKKNLTVQQRPFEEVYTGIDKTQKRALTIEALRLLRNLDLSHKKKLAYARDLFMFSFYTRGMAFVDMAHLCKENIKEGTITYHRKKTGQKLVIGLESCMAEIIERYSSFKVTNDKQYLTQFRNSKYVFSEPYFSYKEIEELLRKGHTVVIIALPCQIAAYRKIYNKFKNVYYIDLICHGVISASFLQQHVYNIELKSREKIQKIYFRDPLYNTDTFTFTLYNESGKCVYSKNVLENDFYQEAYHDGIAYRENCYHCNFASTKRISDITLGDYYGLGKETPFNFSHKKVSCLLVNTSRGKDLLGKLIESNMIKAIERPREEPINGNRMLRQPCLKSRKRKYFEYYIVKFNGDFNSAISAVIKRYSKWKKMNEFILCLKRSIKQRLK